MADNYIVLRASPDWLTLDLDQTRGFCRRFGLPEDRIIKFADRWHETFAVVDFKAFRHDLKTIALTSIAKCNNSQLRTLADVVARTKDDDLIAFLDDDDWLAPNLFEILRSTETPDSGLIWGSIYLGNLQIMSPTEDGAATGLVIRALDDVIYTNNYAITGRALRRLGPEAVLEHFDAQKTADAGLFRARKIDAHLSCTNKHPCGTMWINHFPHPSCDSLRDAVTDYSNGLAKVRLNAQTEWIEPYLRQLQDVVRRTLSGRRT